MTLCVSTRLAPSQAAATQLAINSAGVNDPDRSTTKPVTRGASDPPIDPPILAIASTVAISAAGVRPAASALHAAETNRPPTRGPVAPRTRRSTWPAGPIASARPGSRVGNGLVTGNSRSTCPMPGTKAGWLYWFDTAGEATYLVILGARGFTTPPWQRSGCRTAYRSDFAASGFRSGRCLLPGNGLAVPIGKSSLPPAARVCRKPSRDGPLIRHGRGAADGFVDQY